MKRIRDIVRNNVGYQSDTMNYLWRFLNKGNRVSQLGNLVLNLSRKALGKRDGFGFVDNAVNPELFHVYQAVGDGLPSLSGLYRMISNKAVKVVSFDIFDTLLCRPTIDPTDIFGYVAMQVDRKYGIDFASIRASIEPRLNNPYTTFEDIYVEFGRISKLSKSDVDEIKALELQTERQLLFPRKEIRAVYEHAVKEGKRIIATSDMYIDGKTLLEILHQNGYVAIDRVYVSCDERARKDQDGQLFDHVLAEEGITCSELLHVGDNEKSDYAYPVQKGISAFWYPSVITQIYRNDTLWRKFYPDRFAGFDIGTRMVYGYLLNMYGHLLMERKNAHMYGNAYEFGLFGLGPIVLMSMVKVLHDDRIQNGYKKIYFASRDGYLPQKAYEILRKNLKTGNESMYFYAGRKLYYPALIEDYDAFMAVRPKNETLFTIGDFVLSRISDRPLLDRIFSKLSPNELGTLRTNGNWSSVLNGFRAEIEMYLERSRQGLAAYYSEVFSTDEHRSVVFDCGYSGSISTALSRIVGNRSFDKIYMWEKQENKVLDERNNTRTYLLIDDLEKFNGIIHLLFEECFSDCNPRATGILENGQLVFADEHYPECMKSVIDEIQRACLDFVDGCSDYFSNKLLEFGSLQMLSHIVHCFEQTVFNSPYNEVLSLFGKIRFNDDMYGTAESLGKKLADGVFHGAGFSGTAFCNPDKYILDYPSRNYICHGNAPQLRICIHAHIYNLSLVPEFLYYFSTFPFKFDLFITTPSDFACEYLNNIASACCGNLEKVVAIAVENRGRDVAPWIVEMGKRQWGYDIVCHVHSKVHFEPWK